MLYTGMIIMKKKHLTLINRYTLGLVTMLVSTSALAAPFGILGGSLVAAGAAVAAVVAVVVVTSTNNSNDTPACG